MNRTEHLLFKLAEECCEIAQEASKAAIFGLHEVMPGQPLTNAERVNIEFNDLLAVLEMLAPKCGLATNLLSVDRKRIEAKKAKVQKYMDYAEHSCGTLCP